MCNKCRVGFDHHCRYINNCVTQSNYYIFFFGCLLLVTSAIIAMTQLIIYGITYKNNKNIYLSSATKYLKQKVTPLIFWILYAVSIGFYLGLAIPMMVLIIYHIFFQVNGISTYDYIMDNISKFPQRLTHFSCITNYKIKRE